MPLPHGAEANAVPRHPGRPSAIHFGVDGAAFGQDLTRAGRLLTTRSLSFRIRPYSTFESLSTKVG